MKAKGRERTMADKKKRRFHESSVMEGEIHDPKADMEDKAFLSVSTVETSDDAISQDPERGHHFLEQKRRANLRVPAQEILGKPISILIPPAKRMRCPRSWNASSGRGHSSL